MIKGNFLVVESNSQTGSDGKTYNNVTLADPDGDGTFPIYVRTKEGEKPNLPPALTMIEAGIKLTGYSRPAKSTRTGNEYVQTSVSAELVAWKAVAEPVAKAA